MKSVIRLTTLFLAAWLISCNPEPPPPPNPGEGFFIETSFIPLVGPILIAGNITTHWDWVQDLQIPGLPPNGNSASFNNTTNLGGIGVSQDGRVPAVWNVTWLTPAPDPSCEFKSAQVNASHFNGTASVACFEVPLGGNAIAQGNTFVFSPGLLYTDGSSGSTATISGQGLTSRYGMPVLRYFDSSGNLVNQASAQVIASDGTWVQAPIPDISQLVPGSYTGVLYNIDSSGNLVFLGTTGVSVMDPPQPPPPGGCTESPCPILSRLMLKNKYKRGSPFGCPYLRSALLQQRPVRLVFLLLQHHG